ncbi:prepilin-type N-terminal cleavage/methylation domain-containing protein [Acetobacterium wieringae]|uniref:Prepilin-type N-terminal cleavage/methylation domain-containing protein n=1 Tax=Acetobacterium wieringae TaxID=52694 RepID=A0A5D0WTP3_9FIRM|nr:prepilin-type N-terminal cleavage/methylation domain-containing protein [Acetobacterium wieringae]TYC87564.1 prepilin-type N-terminal cleavage/methylation domain-containing protein [Acetobacterium wieringae]
MMKLKKALETEGFTLVELVVTLLITSVLLATIGSAFLFSQKIYTRSENISYKAGVVTNTETNFQNYLATATDVKLLEAPVMDKKSYNIGFNNAGICEEIIVTLSSDGSSYLVNSQVLSHISEIYVWATGEQTAVLNYKLVPIDTTMTTLAGGIVMNNINDENKNMPEDNLKTGSNLNSSGNSIHYLVLTYESGSGDIVIPDEPNPDINEQLADKGIIVGNWDKMIAKAKVNYGYLLSPNGAVYTDSSGTYVTGDLQYISESFAKTDPLASTYNTNTGGANSMTFIKISEESRFITAADYETDAYRLDRGFKWKDGQRPRLGDLYIYNDAIYVWQRLSTYEMPQNPTTDINWLKLVSAPEEFQ